MMSALCSLFLSVLVMGGSAYGQSLRILTLTEALKLSQEHSPVLKAAQQNVQAAEAEKMVARSAFLPKLEVSETFTNTNNPAAAFGILLNQGRFTQSQFDITTLNRPGAKENYRSAISLMQPVYNGGREWLGMKMARIGQEASGEGLAVARQGVLFSVTKSYYDLMLAKAFLLVARDTVRISESNTKVIESRYRGGATVKSDLLQAEVQLATHREGMIRADQAVQVAKIALRHTIGLDEPVDVAATLTSGNSQLGDLDTQMIQALQSRADYRKMEAELRKAETGVQLAKSFYFPTFNVQASYELNNTTPFSQNGSNNYMALGILSLNLFNGLSDMGKVRKSKAEEIKAREQLAAKRRKIEVEVVEAYRGVVEAQERLLVTQRVIVQAKENLRIIRNRYRSGIAPVIDLLTAEFVLNRAQRSRLRAMYDEHIGQARLKFVTGQFHMVAG